MTTHLVIPDCQVKPGVPTDHLSWIGRYIVNHFAGQDDLKIVCLGDFADMESLSSYNRKLEAEGKRYIRDVQAANHGWALLNDPLVAYNKMRKRNKDKQWWPERHITLGNHEDRITRAVLDDPKLEGFLSLDHLDYARSGWTVHPFLEPVDLDGVVYCHYFYNPMTSRPYSGENLKLRLKTIGHSFTMGHQQTYDVAIRYVNGKQQRALVAGACYLHDEDYKGPQGNAHWRGILVCHDVKDGAYDLMEVSLDYLARRYS